MNIKETSQKMIKRNTLKVPGQTRDKKKQQNNENRCNRVRLPNVFNHCERSCESYFKSQLLLICEWNLKLSHFPQKCDTHLSP